MLATGRVSSARLSNVTQNEEKWINFLEFIEKEKVFDPLKVYQTTQDGTPLSKGNSN